MTKSNSAIRTLNIVSGLDGRNVVAGYAERAQCPCGALLDFGFDAIGRTIERCTDASCANSRPHSPGTLNRHQKPPSGVPR